MYLDETQRDAFRKLLKSYFALPYSNDLSGKDAETLIRIAKGAADKPSKKKELFDIVDGEYGYSVKTLSKSPRARRVDLQEQRFCDVEQVRELKARGGKEPDLQGHLLLTYIHDRIQKQMDARQVKVAKSLILLKHWNEERTRFQFRYWEEDFLGWIDNLVRRNAAGEIEWVVLRDGLHGRDRKRQDGKGKNVRLIRMHYKHNQIFTDHDIPSHDEVDAFDFTVDRLSWTDVMEVLAARQLGSHRDTEAQR